MSDLDYILAMLRRTPGYEEKPGLDKAPQSVELGAGSGYRDFAASLLFDDEGRLVGHSSWE